MWTCPHVNNQAIGGLPYFVNRSLMASRSKSCVELSRSSPRCLSCLDTAGSKCAATVFFPTRLGTRDPIDVTVVEVVLPDGAVGTDSAPRVALCKAAARLARLLMRFSS